MKKLDVETIASEERLRRKRERRRLKRRLKIKRRLLETGSIFSNYSEVAAQLPRVNVPSPITMDLGVNCEQTLKFIDRVRAIARGGQAVAVLDFRRLQQISIEAALLVAAVASSLRSRFRGRCHGIHSLSPEVNWVLEEIGYFEAIGVETPKIGEVFEPTHSGSRIRIRTGAVLNTDNLGGHVSAEFAKSIVPEGVLRRQAAKSMNEALVNALDHAYPGHSVEAPAPPYVDLLPHWWVCGYVDQSERAAGFIALDLGVGIPKSMAQKWTHRVRAMGAALLDPDALLLGSNDHHLVRTAMMLNATGVNLPGRGKGFSDIKGLVDSASDGELRVVSGRGDCRHYSGKSDVEAKLIPVGLPGTMISWHLKGSDAVVDQAAGLFDNE